MASRCGLLPRYEVFDGNRQHGTTLFELVRALSEALRQTGISWVLTDSPIAVPPAALMPHPINTVRPAAG